MRPSIDDVRSALELPHTAGSARLRGEMLAVLYELPAPSEAVAVLRRRPVRGGSQ